MDGPAGTEVAKPPLAELLTATPSARAKLFSNPTRFIARSLPPYRWWRYVRTSMRWWGNPARWWDRRNARRQVAQEALSDIAGDIAQKRITAAMNTDVVFEEFFEPIVKTSQRSFTSVFGLSYAVFLVGVGLIAVGAIMAFDPPHNVDATVVSSIFGGTGAISALGAVYTMAKDGIREATLDHARVRLVLTAFATQLGQLRAFAEDDANKEQDDKGTPDLRGKEAELGRRKEELTLVKDVNDAVRTAMDGALANLPVTAKASLPAESNEDTTKDAAAKPDTEKADTGAGKANGAPAVVPAPKGKNKKKQRTKS